MVCADSVSTYVCGRRNCSISTFCDALLGTAAYDSLSWISSGYEDLGCSLKDSMSSRISMVWVVVICSFGALYYV